MNYAVRTERAKTEKYVESAARGMPNCKLTNYETVLSTTDFDKVVFMGVNDPCVMDEWNKIYGHEKIDAIADPLAVFTKQLGFEHDYGKTMGIRCHRFAILIDNGELIKEFKSPYIEGVLGEL